MHHGPPRRILYSLMRAALRIFFCLAAWLMLSPVAMAAPDCQATPTLARHVMACCESGAPCDMPAAQRDPLCPKCEPLAPLAVPPAIPDFAPPLFVLVHERSITFERIGIALSFVPAVRVHPPPDTLLALGAMLTC